MRQLHSKRAFSLIEVVIAIAVVAGAVVVILGLLSQLAKQAGRADDTQTALRMPDAVAVELRALVAQRGFDAVATSAPIMSTATDEGLLLVAARDGSQVRVLTAGESPAREQYFLIELRRFPSAPLAYSTSAAAVALNVRITWPYRVLTPTGLTNIVSFTERQQVNFNLAINR